jgi:uncharacterized protein (TIRG00374 family)
LKITKDYNLKKLIKYSLSTLIAAALLYWSFTSSGVNWSLIIHYFYQANYFWVLASILIGLFAHVIRGLRWNQLLNSLNYQPSLVSSFMAVMIGYLASFLIPRLGEFSRCISLNKTNKIPVDKSFGTVITERIADLFGMFALFILAIIFSFEPIKENFFPEFNINDNAILVITIVLFFIILIFIGWRLISQNGEFTTEKLEKLPFAGKYLSGFSEGLFSITKVDKISLFIFYSLIIWISYFLGTYFLFKAFDLTKDLGWTVVLTTFTMGTIGMVIPTQGGIGSYHGLVAAALVFFSINSKDGFALATFFHGTQMVTILLFGCIGLIYTFIYKKKEIEDSKENS